MAAVRPARASVRAQPLAGRKQHRSNDKKPARRSLGWPCPTARARSMDIGSTLSARRSKDWQRCDHHNG
eukprot:4140789-Alexandrium_andersonii.AAC.1